jgi:hypothetical protein
MKIPSYMKLKTVVATGDIWLLLCTGTDTIAFSFKTNLSDGKNENRLEF